VISRGTQTLREAPHESVVPFVAGDGLHSTLIRVRGRNAARGPVLLVHGAGVRANIFRPPGRTDIVQYLVARGYDVWLENWRASIDVPASEWTLDDAAVYDHPAAVAAVVAATGAARIKALVHCQGSTSFVMSAFAGLLPQVDTIVSNAVSLHVVVPVMAAWKLNHAVPVVSRFMTHLDPRWGIHGAPHPSGKALDRWVRWSHRECDSAVCKWSSFTYGAGFPTLWRHENLSQATHAWLDAEFGSVPLSFFRQMRQCARLGSLCSLGKHAVLPLDFLKTGPQTDARFALIAGELNECFLARGQELTFRYLENRRPGVHSLRIVPGYGHLDIFLGRNAATEVFPLIARELEHD
jgi:predicted alpha/beta hydrolase